MEKKAVLFSIKPKYVSLISTGEKKYELRRKCPKVSAGDLALVYETSPTMCLVGAFIIGDILQCKPAALWRKIGAQSGVSQKVFIDYFNGCETASAIGISQYWQLEQQVPLKQLRSKNKIEPPQSYRYLCSDKIGKLLSQGTEVCEIRRKENPLF